jgi:tetratricopeptide (TPR) repeat protein
MGRLDDALLFLQKAERLCLELGADAELAAIYGKLGTVHLQREDYARAVALHRRDVKLCRRFGNSRALAFAVRNLGLSLRAHGDLEEAGHCLAEALHSFRSLQDQVLTMRLHLDLAEVWLDWGRLPEAERNLQLSRELLHVDSPDLDRARLWLLTGTLERFRQCWGDSQEAYLEALRILAEVGPTAALAEVRYELGQLHTEARDSEQAVYHLRECLDLARQLGVTHLARKAMETLDRLDQVEVVDLLLEELEGPGEPSMEGTLQP